MTFSSGQVSTLDILLPIKLPKIPELKLFLSTAETVQTRISQHAKSVENTPELIKRARNATFRLIRNHHYRASADKLDYTYLFLPGEGSGETWDQFPNKSIPALEAYKSGIEMGIIREHDDIGDSLGALYIFERWRHDLNPLDFSSKLEGELLKQPIMEVTKLT
ncbi:hypothetical protein BZA77DRAFT_157897 [Pyronema omphalodes]|nr:hypothetical protein BZA77DRAFT_157897 [Pyronema omphalodes]